jgi:hypothetical protein
VQAYQSARACLRSNESVPDPGPDEPDDSAPGKIAAIIVILALLGSGFWLIHRLGDASAIQDCVSTGRRDCGQTDTGNR